MKQYLSFLRGINMTGHNSMKMTDLKTLYFELGFKNVETYIQSGNVIFNAPDNYSEYKIALKIEETILKRFNYTIPVMIRTREELLKLSSVNPFLTDNDFAPSKLAVIFLHNEATEDQINKVKHLDYPPDKFLIHGREIFIFCPNGFGKTKLYTNFFENKMGVTGTARNWKTITTILDMI